jgi:predicted SAM-dependent methyltransferase
MTDVLLEPVPALRVNLGSGAYPLRKWTNVDRYCDADIRGDLRELQFKNLEAVNMSHVLEHLSWRETLPILERVRSWMRSGAELTIEVPDMTRIMALGTVHPLWFKFVYGDQSHLGEFHLSGFTQAMLHEKLEEAGFSLVTVTREISDHKGREGMPILVAKAMA